MTIHRLERLQQLMEQKGHEVVAVIPGPTLFYLTGLSFHLIERPVVSFFKPGKPVVLVLPELEQSKAETSPLSIDLLPYGEDETSRSLAFRKAGEMLKLENAKIGIEPLGMRAFEIQLLKDSIPGVAFISAEDTLSELRILKDQSEIEAMRNAVIIAETSLKKTLSRIQIGMTEKELAAELIVQLLRSGSDSKLPFEPIVASGPNSALPHAVPGDRELREGDLLIIDWGARVQGYISDLTRTFALGDIDPELEKIHTIVQESNAAGHAAIQVGVQCGIVDRASRTVIDEAGYGEYFIHRTGHGIGLQSHEEPYIRDESTELLQVGMTFTVEPGIYLPGRGGVRIEDDVVVTSTGGESLSSFPRDLQVIS
ncbi:MAG: M24 family metallopeptidase [Anaerolineales bacterium]|nr:M24 family metallopeptidase [Anaerolineales bacterium]